MMDYERCALTIHVTVDMGGGERQERDKALWAELCEKIEKLVKQSEYKPIDPITSFTW